MRSIVEKYGSQALLEYFRDRGHNALVDAKSLGMLVTARGMFHRILGSATTLDT